MVQFSHPYMTTGKTIALIIRTFLSLLLNTLSMFLIAFLMVQLSHPYMITGKTIALTTWIFVGKVMSLLRFVIAFLPRSKCLLISWLQSVSTVILELD